MRGNGYKQPGNWKQTRAMILERDGHACKCGRPAISVDHITPVAAFLRAGLPPDHTPHNLRAICASCKAAKDEQDRLDGVASRPRARRAPERHPGLA